jgi:transposase InsO family protein
MSAKGYCYDNAFMESWFKTLKAEEVYLDCTPHTGEFS